MDRFNYQSVLIGVVVGLAVAELLSTVAHHVSARHKTRIYWVHLAWLALVFMLTVQYWFAAFLWQRMGDALGGSFEQLLLTLSVPIMLYLSASLIAPEAPREGETLDYRAYYYANHRGIFLMFALTIAVLAVQRTIAGGGSWLRASNGYRALGILCLVSLATWRHPRFHAIMTIVVVAIFVAFVVVFR